MKIKELEGAIEAILFAMGESVELSRIAKAINMDTKTTEKLIHNMMDRYEQEERGIQIIELGDSYQMCTRKKYYEYLINIALHPQKPVLTEVMPETLSIIAYKQPVTKAELEKIRGVKCDHAINKLMANRTTFAIAHRLSTIRNATQILVMDKGAIIERGTHEQLSASGGAYRRLCDMQMLE